MITLVFSLLSAICALTAVLAHVFEKNWQAKANTQDNAVKAQLSNLNAENNAIQQKINQEQQNLANQEKGETNDSILQAINYSSSSNPPKS